MAWEQDDEFELHQSQRNLALQTVDDLTEIKLALLDAGKPVPKFINNSISYLKKKYVTEEKTVSQFILKKEQDRM